MTNMPDSAPVLVDPTLNDPLSLSQGKSQEVYVKDINDELEATATALLKRSSASLVTPDIFTTFPVAVINAADSLTGWTAVTAQTAPALDTAIKTEGSSSISVTLYNSTAQPGSKMYYNLAAPLDVTGRSHVAIDLRWATGGPAPGPQYYEAVIASGAALTGTVSVRDLDGMAVSTWTTILIPCTGLTTISSVGIRVDPLDTMPASATARTAFWIDNVKLADQSKLESAVASATTIGVLVPPAYPAEPSAFIYGPTKGLLDLRASSSVHGRHGGIRHAREWAVAEDGSVDVTSIMNQILGELVPGDTLQLSAKGKYLMNGPWELTGMQDVIIDGQGARIFSNVERGLVPAGFDDNILKMTTCKRMTFRNLNLVGYRKDSFNGNTLTNVTGTPAISGTTKLLAAQNDEVRIPLDANAETPYYARDVDGNYIVEATLSDTAHTVGDCIVQIVDVNAPTTVIGSSTLTLTATPTLYRLAVRGDFYLGTRLRLSVKKVSATANTITVANMHSYGRLMYISARSDIQSGFDIVDSQDITIEDSSVEGVLGDGVVMSDQTTKNVIVRRVFSRACSRQGMSFNRGSYVLVEDCIIREPHRSGIDIEPYADDWLMSYLTIRNCQILNARNASIAAANWARIWYLDIDGLESQGARLGAFACGSQFGNFRNIVSRDLGDFVMLGRNCRAENISTQFSFQCLDSNGTYNDGAGVVTYQGTGNVLNGITITSPRTGNGFVFTSPDSSFSHVSLLDDATGAITWVTGAYSAPIRVGTDPEIRYAGLDPGKYRVRYPNSHKGIAYSPGSIWMPGGFDHLNDPLYKVRGISATSTKPNNLGKGRLAVTAGATSLNVTFPTRAIAAVGTDFGNIVAGVGGTLTPSTTYYYRIAARDIYGGPGPVIGAQRTVALSGAQNAVSVGLKGWAVDGNAIVPGVTVYRGTVSGGPYTTRYDVVPNQSFYGSRQDIVSFVDTGTTLVTPVDVNAFGYAASFAAQAGSFTPVDETGYELDNLYTVFVSCSWPAEPYVDPTLQTTAGFPVSFGVPCPVGGGLLSYFLVRM